MTQQYIQIANMKHSESHLLEIKVCFQHVADMLKYIEFSCDYCHSYSVLDDQGEFQKRLTYMS